MTILSRLALGGLLLSASAMLPQSVAAQAVTKARPTTVPAAARPAQAAIGTFQIIALTNKVQVGLSTDALGEIEARRDDTKEVSWAFSDYARVRILPRRVINAPGFRPVPVQVAYHEAAR